MNEPYNIDDQIEAAWKAIKEGRVQEGFALFDELVKREKVIWIYVMRGVARTMTKDYQEAAEDFARIRTECFPKCAIPYVGMALWLAGDHEAACKDWTDEIARNRLGEVQFADPAGGIEAPALLWWASAHKDFSGWRKIAVSELHRLTRNKALMARGWPGPIGRFLLGEISEADLLQADSNSVLALRNRRHCEAHFYIGAIYLSLQQSEKYQEHLTLALSLGEHINTPEYHLALAERQM